MTFILFPFILVERFEDPSTERERIVDQSKWKLHIEINHYQKSVNKNLYELSFPIKNNREETKREKERRIRKIEYAGLGIKGSVQKEKKGRSLSFPSLLFLLNLSSITYSGRETGSVTIERRPAIADRKLLFPFFSPPLR